MRDSGKRSREELLRLAAEEGDYSDVKALLLMGADPNQGDEEGLTALMLAARWGRFDSARVLLDHGANPTLCSKDGRTALDMAPRGIGDRDIKKTIRVACRIWEERNLLDADAEQGSSRVRRKI